MWTFNSSAREAIVTFRSGPIFDPFEPLQEDGFRQTDRQAGRESVRV